MQLINVQLMKHPMNWITVLLMVIIAGFVAKLVLKWETSS